MRTILVNRPRRRRRHRNAGGPLVLRNATLLANPRRRRKASRRRRHQHWGIVAGHQRRTHNPRRRRVFMANRRHRRNALILPNRRRYRRRNPFGIGPMVNTLFVGALGGGGAWAFNQFLVKRIQLQPDGSYPTTAIWWHLAARAVAASVAGMFLPEKIASAANGGLAYASVNEIYNYATMGSATGADLSGLEADLSDVLDGY